MCMATCHANEEARHGGRCRVEAALARLGKSTSFTRGFGAHAGLVPTPKIRVVKLKPIPYAFSMETGLLELHGESS